MLIADSGSTKTQWALIGAGEKKFCKTRGINPMIQQKEEIAATLREELLPKLGGDEPGKIIIYCAGCSTEKLSNIVKQEAEKIFSSAEINVHHDLDASARALFGDNKGIAIILGTGSNSCFYNGSKVIQKVPSLGFILGDEGSGAHLGRLLIRDFYYKRLPEELSQKMKEEFNLDKGAVFDKVYREANPNTFLAGFATFIGNNINDYEYLRNLVKFSFEQIFDFHLTHYLTEAGHPLGCVGSVGYHFSNILKEVAAERGFDLQKVLQSPIEDLIAYHERKNN